MSPVSAFVLFAVIWFMCLFIALPLRLTTQREQGEVVPGTPASAPTDPKLKQKVKWVTLASVILFIIIVAIIQSGFITIDDFDLFTPK